jgi:Carbohydrate esterase, sialic acid-specific acetylesterase
MNMTNQPTGFAAGAAALLIAMTGMAAAAPVRIFILSGQSNMTGRGCLGDLKKPAAEQKATLVRFIMAPENVEKYKFLHEGGQKDRGGWTVRDDVFITVGDWPHDATTGGKHGGLAPNYGGFRSKGFGPELGIGHALGDFYDEPVLLVKVAFGGCSLAVDMRPPGSGGKLGEKYPLIVKAVTESIEHLPEIIPGYTKETGYEITGFFWNQGESDMSPEASSEYEKNLVNLVTDLRKDVKAPGMKIVVATTGFGGRELAGFTKAAQKEAIGKIIAAQMALPTRPEFQGAAATVETRGFYRPQEPFGGNNQTIHWHANGESYWLMGEAMGREMVKLLEKGK